MDFHVFGSFFICLLSFALFQYSLVRAIIDIPISIRNHILIIAIIVFSCRQKWWWWEKEKKKNTCFTPGEKYKCKKVTKRNNKICTPTLKYGEWKNSIIKQKQMTFLQAFIHVLLHSCILFIHPESCVTKAFVTIIIAESVCNRAKCLSKQNWKIGYFFTKLFLLCVRSYEVWLTFFSRKYEIACCVTDDINSSLWKIWDVHNQKRRNMF